jgi:hypothetical protein
MKSKLFRILGVVAVVAMIATALVAPVSALSGVGLAITLGTSPATSTVTDISNTPINYILTFTPGVAQPATTNAVVVTFDAGIKLPTVVNVGFLTSGPGIGGGAAITTMTYALGTAVGQVVTIDTSTVNVVSGSPAVIVGALGSGAIVQMTFPNVTNPSAIGSYGVTIKTNVETTGVYSNTFTTTNPTLPPVAGIATVYNASGTAITQSNSLATALLSIASYPGGKITLTAGTYNNAFGLAAANTTNCTIQGIVGSASTVILKDSGGGWGLSGATVTIDSVTIDNTGNVFTMSNATAGTVSNCIFKNATGNALVFSGAGTETASNDTFTVKAGATGISSSSAKATVTGSTFTVTGTGWGISSSVNVTVSGSTFTGVAATAPTYTGQGIILSGGTASVIGTSTFTGLSTALDTTAAGVSFTGNTVTTCGMTTPTGVDAIMIHTVTPATSAVSVTNNKISGSLEYIISVAANDNLVSVMDNQFATNVSNASNTGGVGLLNVTHNYWGAATGPASTGTVSYANPLGIAPTAGTFATGVSGMTLTASATAGVNIVGSVAATSLGAAALSGNPVAVAVPSNATVVKYFDVFANNTVTGATVDFFGTTASPVTANSSIYFYNAAYGTWQPCSTQAINTFGNDVEITVGTIGGVTATAPTAAQFYGTPFVLVTVPTTLAAPGAVTYPSNGATAVPVNAANMTFTWPAVVGAGITYQFALAQASANTTANEFAILDYSDNTITNAEPLQETLQYNTVYWWEVRAVTLNSSGAVSATGPWTVSMFTTAAAPVTTTGTSAVVTTVVTSVVITNPVTTVMSTSTNIVLPTNTGTSSPAIPSYLLWAVIAVGAVLIIAVIVLIVRTRRIP